MSTERQTVGDNSYGGGDQVLIGLGARPAVLYTDDRRDAIASTICPTAIDAVVASSNNIHLYSSEILIGSIQR